MIDKSAIKRLATQCNGGLITFGGEPLCYTFAIANLEKFAQAVIKAYVSEQKPVAYRYVGLNESEGLIMLKAYKPKRWDENWWRIEPLYTLENK